LRKELEHINLNFSWHVQEEKRRIKKELDSLLKQEEVYWR
jgi:hypothetical protein